jgi:hypothetical protein
MALDDFVFDEFDEPELPQPVLTPLPDDVPVELPEEYSDAAPASTASPLPTPDDVPDSLPDLHDPRYGSIIDGFSDHGGGGVYPENRPAINLAGKLDCFQAKVIKTYWGSTHPTLGVQQGIDVERIDVRWDSSNNDPVVGVKPTPRMGTAGIISASSFPARGDQAAYIVSEGDIVTILQTGDGQAIYLSDDLPFVGTVVVWDDDDVTEEFNGGVKSNGSVDGIKVRQQIITGNPTSSTATLADREAIGAAWDASTSYLVDDIVVVSATTYRCINANTNNTPPNATYWEVDNIVIHRYVNVLRMDNQAIGYRVGDEVLVVRRGLYLFALPVSEIFLAHTNVGSGSIGPNNESDFSGEHYWLKEVDPVAAYTTNSWTFNPATPAVRSSTDPTGSGGVKGRHIDGVNLAERANATHNLGDGLLVKVTAWTDVNELTYYTFYHYPVEFATTDGMIVDKWFNLAGDTTTPVWVTVDSRNWKGRFVEVAAWEEDGAPAAVGTRIQGALEVWSYFSAAYVAIPADGWIQTFLNAVTGSGNDQLILRTANSGGGANADFELRMSEVDGSLEARVFNWGSQMQVRFMIRAGGQLLSTDAEQFGELAP